jgi:hypothetical protein
VISHTHYCTSVTSIALMHIAYLHRSSYNGVLMTDSVFKQIRWNLQCCAAHLLAIHSYLQIRHIHEVLRIRCTCVHCIDSQCDALSSTDQPVIAHSLVYFRYVPGPHDHYQSTMLDSAFSACMRASRDPRWQMSRRSSSPSPRPSTAWSLHL